MEALDLTLGKEVVETIHKLGELMKNDAACKAYREAETAYLSNRDLNQFLAEYNANQGALSAEYGKGEEADKTVIDAIEKRISDLYDAITTHAAYDTFVRAKETYDLYMQSVKAELEYAISGQRPCTHNCASCGGCH